MKKLTKTLIPIVLSSLTIGCAGPGYYNHPYRGTITGAAVGAAGGALLGHAADDGYGNGALVGGALGAIAGGAAGYYVDKNHRQPRGYDRGYRQPPRGYGYRD